MTKLGKLDKLYQTVANCEDLGLELPHGVIEQINDMEEKLIKDEVLPLIHDNIEPTLRRVQRPLVLVVEYDPQVSLKVNLSRKVNIAAQIADAKEITPDPKAKHGTHTSPKKPVTRYHNTVFSVKWPDGTLIAEPRATDTLELVIRKIGVDRVRALVGPLNLIFCKVPLISNQRDDKYGHTQRELGNGWLLMTHSNNPMKKAAIEKISKALKLNLQVTLKTK